MGELHLQTLKAVLVLVDVFEDLPMIVFEWKSTMGFHSLLLHFGLFSVFPLQTHSQGLFLHTLALFISHVVLQAVDGRRNVLLVLQRIFRRAFLFLIHLIEEWLFLSFFKQRDNEAVFEPIFQWQEELVLLALLNVLAYSPSHVQLELLED